MKDKDGEQGEGDKKKIEREQQNRKMKTEKRRKDEHLRHVTIMWHVAHYRNWHVAPATREEMQQATSWSFVDVFNVQYVMQECRQKEHQNLTVPFEVARSDLGDK